MSDGILSFVLSLIVVVAVTPLVIRFARLKGFIAQPSEDRWHTKPTALLGGIGIFLGICIGIIVSGVYAELPSEILCGLLLIFFSGLYDDIKGLSPFFKLIIQIIATVLVIASGVHIGNGLLPEYIAVPLTIFWVVGITNAMNLLDNMDGLCSGVSGILAFMLGIILMINNQPNLATISLIISGASFGFLVFNFNPAKLFMGDSGSLLLGFSMATISLMGSYHLKMNILLSMSIPLLIMALPIFDTTLVTINRTIVNRRISQGGKDHSSHRLIALGFSEKQSVLVLYSVTVLGGVIAITFNFINVSISLMLLLVSVIIFIGSGAFLTRVKVYSNEEYKSTIQNTNSNGAVTLIKTVLNHKRQIVEVAIDTIIILYSFYFAIWVQNNGIVSVNSFFGYNILPWILVFSLLIMYKFGFYKTIWRYISVQDIIKYGAAITLIVFLLISYKILSSIEELQLSTCLLFGIILSYLLIGFRLSERVFSSLLSKRYNKDRAIVKNILIVGAGDAGNLFIQEIFQNKKLNLNPIGFVDDDPTKIGSTILGVPVLGGIQRIKEIVTKHSVNEILITISKIDHEALLFINKTANTLKITVKRISLDIKTI